MAYNLCREGKGPLVTKVGDRNLIAIEDARAWRKSMKKRTLKQPVPRLATRTSGDER
jgi:hypothetical protein